MFPSRFDTKPIIGVLAIAMFFGLIYFEKDRSQPIEGLKEGMIIKNLMNCAYVINHINGKTITVEHLPEVSSGEHCPRFDKSDVRL